MSKTSEKREQIREFIINNIFLYPSDIVSITAENFGFTRQAASKHVQRLISEGLIATSGTTRNRRYELAWLINEAKTYQLSPGIEEHVVWDEFKPLLKNIPPNVMEICSYGFTEILNNAIDHSEGTEVSIGLRQSAGFVQIIIMDNGIGIFQKIQRAFNLYDKRHAILELAKGKTTSDPIRHTGEGLFFTSRIFDSFSIISDDLFFVHKTELGDWLIEDQTTPYKGTSVHMKISVKSNREMKLIFDRFSDEEHYGFTKTHLPVNLARVGEENLVSRSQAKRLLTHIDRFEEVLLDFTSVSNIGQAFADEIFRVFSNQHPEIKFDYINATPEIIKMINRAKGGKSDAEPDLFGDAAQ